MELYPLKFIPQIHEKIWGGTKLLNELGKPGNQELLAGESWEISGVQDHISEVANGPLAGNSLQDLCEIFMGELMGDTVYEQFGIEFPLLVKFIDANDDLSIQVHPNDELAKERHKAYGKTEMWYILQADPGAKLYFGFNQALNPNLYRTAVEENRIMEYLEAVEVNQGDAFFIPAGKVHAIGKGILLAEIQQTSDVTYRIYDYDRIDAQGAKRELHLDLAQDAIDYHSTNSGKIAFEPQADTAIELTDQKYFKTNYFLLNQNILKDYHELDSFVIYMVLSGVMTIHPSEGDSLDLKKGETLLIPAIIDHLKLEPHGSCEFLEVFIPNYH